MTTKIALVTGAGSGVGRAAALALLADGYFVVLTGRRADALAETIGLAAAPELALAIPADVTDPASVAALFEEVRSRCGRLDLLFNNAGNNVPSTNCGFGEFERGVSVRQCGVSDDARSDAAGRADH